MASPSAERAVRRTEPCATGTLAHWVEGGARRVAGMIKTGYVAHYGDRRCGTAFIIARHDLKPRQYTCTPRPPLPRPSTTADPSSHLAPYPSPAPSRSPADIPKNLPPYLRLHPPARPAAAPYPAFKALSTNPLRHLSRLPSTSSSSQDLTFPWPPRSSTVTLTVSHADSCLWTMRLSLAVVHALGLR